MHAVYRESFPEYSKDILLYPIGDLHYGNIYQRRDLIRKVVLAVQENPQARWICMGDVLELATKQQRGADVYETNMSPDEQLEAFIEDFKPIADKCVGLIQGNHDERLYKNFGLSPVKLAARCMQIEDLYVNDGALVLFRFLREQSKKRSHTYAVYATHGTSTTATISGAASSLQSAGEAIAADIVLGAHNHSPMSFRDIIYVPDFDIPEGIHPVERHYVLTTGFVRYGGYQISSRMRPQPIGQPVIHLSAHEKHICVSL